MNALVAHSSWNGGASSSAAGTLEVSMTVAGPICQPDNRGAIRCGRGRKPGALGRTLVRARNDSRLESTPPSCGSESRCAQNNGAINPAIRNFLAGCPAARRQKHFPATFYKWG